MSAATELRDFGHARYQVGRAWRDAKKAHAERAKVIPRNDYNRYAFDNQWLELRALIAAAEATFRDRCVRPSLAIVFADLVLSKLRAFTSAPKSNASKARLAGGTATTAKGGGR